MAPLAAAAAAALLLALSAPRAADAFGYNSVVALVVSDPVTTFPGAVRRRGEAGRSAAPPRPPPRRRRRPHTHSSPL